MIKRYWYLLVLRKGILVLVCLCLLSHCSFKLYPTSSFDDFDVLFIVHLILEELEERCMEIQEIMRGELEVSIKLLHRSVLQNILLLFNALSVPTRAVC